MAGLIFMAIAALAAAAGFALAVVLVRRHPPVGVGLICLFVITLWEFPNPPPIITLSGLSVYPADVVVFVLFAAGALEVNQLRSNLGGWLIPWALFGVSIAISLLTGVVAFGPGSAVNAARSVLYLFCAMTWALAVRPDRFRLRTASLFLGWALVLIALYHGARFGFGGPSTTIYLGDLSSRNGRVLISTQSMALLLCAATLSLGSPGSEKLRSRFSAVSSLVFAGVVVISQHRSVWAAGALGMLAVLAWSTRRQARMKAFVVLLLGIWIGTIGWATGILDVSEVRDSSFGTNTYEWRNVTRQVLLSQAIAGGPLRILVGSAFGSGAFLRRHGSGGVLSISSHNWYVDVFVSLGLVGLLGLFPMLFWALAKSRFLRANWTFTLAAIATFGWAYYVDWYYVPWLGAALTMSLGVRRAAELPFAEGGRLVNANTEFDACGLDLDSPRK